VVSVRRIGLEDTETVARFRRAMFEELDDFGTDALDGVAAAFVRYLASALPEGRYVGWLAEEEGRALGTVGLVFHDLPPHPLREDVRVGYVMNVFVERDARRRGIATLLTRTAIEHCRSLGLDRVALHASEAGAAVYDRLGFKRTGEMRLTL
jgi:GNAT superfamily N-acetyltransferase